MADDAVDDLVRKVVGVDRLVREEEQVVAGLDREGDRFVAVVSGGDRLGTQVIGDDDPGPSELAAEQAVDGRRRDGVVGERRLLEAPLVQAGVREVTLLGQIVDRYGHDLEEPSDLAELLAVGSEQGVESGMAVIAKEGGSPEALIGVVEQVGPSSSSVLLITDFASSVSALVYHGGESSEGIAQGRWQRGSRLWLEQVEQELPEADGGAAVGLALAGPGQRLDERAVHGGADAEGEAARLGEPLADEPLTAVAGRAVDIEVTVKTVRSVTLPALDAEFAKMVGKYESLDALKEALSKEIEARARSMVTISSFVP